MGLPQVLTFLGRRDLAESALFREIMMGYPEKWTESVPPIQGIRLMGNSIVPQVALIPLKRILDLHNGQTHC